MTRVSSAAIARAIDIRRSGAGNRATSENIIGEKGECGFRVVIETSHFVYIINSLLFFYGGGLGRISLRLKKRLGITFLEQNLLLLPFV